MEVEVRAALVSTIRPRESPPRPRHSEFWRVEEPSMFSPGNKLSSLIPLPTLTPPPKPTADTGRPRGLVLSSEHSGGGRGLRGELRMRAGFETEESRVGGKLACGW